MKKSINLLFLMCVFFLFQIPIATSMSSEEELFQTQANPSISSENDKLFQSSEEEGFEETLIRIVKEDTIPLAENGNAEAQCSLGDAYRNGTGVPKNMIEAVKWYKLAAKQGNADAQWRLGGMYEDGNGVTPNQKKSVVWYRQAANQGHAAAQLTLGGCYACGTGVPQDNWEAVRLYKLAADQGLALAQNQLGICYKTGAYGVKKDYVEAKKWFRLAAENQRDTSCKTLSEDFIKEINEKTQLIDHYEEDTCCIIL